MSEPLSEPRHGLARWLREQWNEPVEIGDLDVSTAGARRQNLRFTATRESGTATRLVATIVPAGLPVLLDVTAETAVRTLAQTRGVPVPTVLGVCTDESYVGGAFYVSELIEGETIGRQIFRLVDEHGIGEQVVHQLGAALGRLHTVPADEAAGMLGVPVTTAPIADGLVRTSEAMELLLQPEPALSYGMRWLREHAPPEPALAALVHSDARTGNLIIGPDGLRAVLDWEGAFIGDPMIDVAWTTVRMWRFGRDDRTIGGLGSIESLRAGYESVGGAWDEDRFLWWRVQNTLKWGIGLSTQTAAHLDRSFRSIVMAGSGRRVPEMEYDLLLLTVP